MGSGGVRRGAGRKKKSQETKEHNELINTGQPLELAEAVDSKMYLRIEKYLSSANKKLYSTLHKEGGTSRSPLLSLYELRDDLEVRYAYARIAELEGVETAKRIAEHDFKELTEKGTVGGKAPKDPDKEAIKLRGQIVSKFPKLSTAVTLLAGEVRMLNDLIDKIESNRSDTTMNIFNILKSGNNAEVGELDEKIFTLPNDLNK